MIGLITNHIFHLAITRRTFSFSSVWSPSGETPSRLVRSFLQTRNINILDGKVKKGSRSDSLVICNRSITVVIKYPTFAS